MTAANWTVLDVDLAEAKVNQLTLNLCYRHYDAKVEANHFDRQYGTPGSDGYKWVLLVSDEDDNLLVSAVLTNQFQVGPNNIEKLVGLPPKDMLTNLMQKILNHGIVLND